MKKLGIIGGMGPEASARFYRLFTQCAHAAKDQDHPDVILLSLASTPDRTAFITGASAESPLDGLIAAARTLEGLGAGLIAIPCVTSHVFYEQLAACVSVPILHILRETAQRLAATRTRRAGILATGGTLAAGIIPQIFAEYGIGTLTPGPQGQGKLMRLIYGHLKTGDFGGAPELFEEILADGGLAGADKVVLACTELSLLTGERPPGERFVDPLVILAERAMAVCREREDTVR